MSEKRCPYCGQNYAPYARAVERQKHCGQAACRRKHERGGTTTSSGARRARSRCASGRRIGATRSSGAPSAGSIVAAKRSGAPARRSERNKRKERTDYRDRPPGASLPAWQTSQLETYQRASARIVLAATSAARTGGS